MIISHTPKPYQQDFEQLLLQSEETILAFSKETSNFATQYAGTKLEDLLFENMNNHAKGTIFSSSIEKISGHYFPDIIAGYPVNRFFGVEVKTTTQNHWTTTGNSILESTRRSNIDNIYLFFGKLGGSVEFKTRLYQDCLMDVAVTHQPRYRIDMNLERGNTIFDKINIDYDSLRNSPNPVKEFSKRYKEYILKPGEEVWWLDTDSKLEELQAPIIRILNLLSKKEQLDLLAEAFVLFPEVFTPVGIDKGKYNRFSTWLVKNHSIVCSNVRDFFSAGGRKNIDGVSVPKIIFKWISVRSGVKSYLRKYGIDQESYLQIVVKNVGLGEPQITIDFLRRQFDGN